MQTNAYGLIMTGLEEAAHETAYLADYRVAVRGGRVQIGYHPQSGKVIADFLTQGSYLTYHEGTIYVDTATHPLSAQEIADKIAKAMEKLRQMHISGEEYSL